MSGMRFKAGSRSLHELMTDRVYDLPRQASAGSKGGSVELRATAPVCLAERKRTPTVRKNALGRASILFTWRYCTCSAITDRFISAVSGHLSHSDGRWSLGVALKSKLLSGAASAAVALGMSAPAYAQSRTTPAALPSWSGFYLGAHAGVAWGRADAATSSDCGTAAPLGYYCRGGAGGANATAVDASGSGKLSDTGFNGGFQAGYNWQASQFVFGVEADIGLFRLHGSRYGSGPYLVGTGGVPVLGQSYVVGSSFETDWLATYRGRLGWANDNWLLYVTGGGAATRLQMTSSFADTLGGGATGSASATKNGWVIGGGIEWMLSQNWTVKAEYLHVDFGGLSSSATITSSAYPGYAQGISTSTKKLNADIARFGLNYKF